MFCFLIDPAGWTEIAGEAFAPGMFVWNSEVGCRSDALTRIAGKIVNAGERIQVDQKAASLLALAV